MPSITQSQPWQALTHHQHAMESVHMRDMFAADPGRFERFSLQFGDILFDYSKNRITAETMSLLMDLARAADLQSVIDAMFAGDST